MFPISFVCSNRERREERSSSPSLPFSPSSTFSLSSICDGHRDNHSISNIVPAAGTTSSSMELPHLFPPATSESSSLPTTLPPDLVFNEDSITSIVAYCILLAISAVGNISVIVALIRLRHRKSRVDFMLTHLAVADLVVTFVMIPMEIGWRVTIQWLAGNIACKVFLFVRAFGLYLSSMVLVCVTLDRYFAVLHPLRVSEARHRAKTMICIAWAVAFVCSFPQSIIFHVSRHPQYPNFKQCVSFGSFDTEIGEMMYNLFCVVVMYFFPLFVICCAYTRILIKLCRRPTVKRVAVSSKEEDSCSRSIHGDGGPTVAASTSASSEPRYHLRRSDVTNRERARSRTLRMTVNIVVVFICCWTPYVVMTLWYTFHRESAQNVDSRVQDLLFITSVSNSCMNPLVYGNYVCNFRQLCTRVAPKICGARMYRTFRYCPCCGCICGKLESMPESVIIELVPATVRPLRGQVMSMQANSQPPGEKQKSTLSMSRMITRKPCGDYQEHIDSQGFASRAVSPERRRYYSGRNGRWSLTPEHSSAPAEMPTERERRKKKAEWAEEGSSEWGEISALSDSFWQQEAEARSEACGERYRRRKEGRGKGFRKKKGKDRSPTLSKTGGVDFKVVPNAFNTKII